jgi:hypothetical protein
MAGGKPDKGSEDVMTIMLVMAIGCICLVFLVWVSSSVRIVKSWTPIFITVSKSWSVIPGGSAKVQVVEQTGRQFLAAPAKVSFWQWTSFVEQACALVSYMCAALVAAWLMLVLLHKRDSVMRRWRGQSLAEHASAVFTGCAPVLHLRKRIARNSERGWRRQTFPHEVLLHEKVHGKPLVMDGVMVPDQAARYFRGLQCIKLSSDDPRFAASDGGYVAKLIDGVRFNSSMLGRQVVHLVHDASRHHQIVFSDRFSSVGKVLFALFTARAFGAEEGKLDYEKARDQLNNSARGVAHGHANLVVAQWLYDKYRGNSMAARVFAVHHWEYTVLYELLRQAKRQGKCGHWEFMWLKPMARVLFYAANNVGRMVAHTEAAATFAQHAFERRVAMMGRVPLFETEGGSLQHTIFNATAVRGLGIEWTRWSEGGDDDEDWWTSDNVWRVRREMEYKLAPPPPPLGALTGDTPFDEMMRKEYADAESSEITW